MEELKNLRKTLNQSLLKDIEVTNREKHRIVKNLKNRTVSRKYSKLKYGGALVATAFIFLILTISFLPTEELQPLSLIQEEFTYDPFVMPDGWDIVTVQEELKLIKHDLYNPENNEFDEIPLAYILEFGKKTEDNLFSAKEYRELLEKQNEDTYVWGSKIKYSHSYIGEKYGSLAINRLEYQGPLKETDIPDMEVMEFNGIKVYIGNFIGNEVYLWEKDNRFYSLYLQPAVFKRTDVDLIEILSGFISELP
ncbi:hypothetical protein QA612_05635 [Evansella sp. AB-P1]|uniref:hypothetical protein n=1 Tax=Evansella sp. AB-P1 TaxID=3037653 RepID=UPI00241F50A7|nr:hypothetical protein [Evansella sp. AB-P1]MDG5786966.1 hypothetical protein [Evansella sp. AB-P1]